MFNKKSKQIEDLSYKNYELAKELQSIKQLCSYKKDDFQDFITILQDIQNTNNKSLHWKKRQSTINNKIDLAIENYETKIRELDVNA